MAAKMSDLPNKPDVPPALERAWAAGVFEGRVVSIPDNKNFIKFESSNVYLMDRFKEAAGVGSVTLRERDLKSGQYQLWTYKTTSLDDTRTLLKYVLPVLSPNKAAQCAAMLARIERNPHWKSLHANKAAEGLTGKDNE